MTGLDALTRLQALDLTTDDEITKAMATVRDKLIQMQDLGVDLADSETSLLVEKAIINYESMLAIGS